MESFLIKIVLVAAVLIIGLIGFRYLEKKTLYFPLRKIEATPKDIRLDYEDLSIMTKDGIQLAGWFIPAKRPRATLLFCHGNGGNISHRMEKIKLLNALNVDILIFDYRGYGMSKGRPSEHGLYLDAEAAYAYLITSKEVLPEKIIVFGESLGSAVAVDF
ncbi:MAG: alpha/beta hydrolase, partial [Thermodesulfovibrionia bacterium]|nr:alpha/beta hydrolase [Thermodesulfovibrionia bacterium]